MWYAMTTNRIYLFDFSPYLLRVSNVPADAIKGYLERALFTYSGINVEPQVSATQLCQYWPVLDRQIGSLLRLGVFYPKLIVDIEQGNVCRLDINKECLVLYY